MIILTQFLTTNISTMTSVVKLPQTLPPPTLKSPPPSPPTSVPPPPQLYNYHSHYHHLHQHYNQHIVFFCFIYPQSPTLNHSLNVVLDYSKLKAIIRYHTQSQTIAIKTLFSQQTILLFEEGVYSFSHSYC